MKKYLVRAAGWLIRKLEVFLQAQNKSLFAKQSKELFRRLEQIKKKEQDDCSHLAGGNPLSEGPDVRGRTSIVWHITDTGTQVGVCTNCQRQFWPTDSDYTTWIKKPSINRTSAAGTRYWPRGVPGINYPRTDGTRLEEFPPNPDIEVIIDGLDSLSDSEERDPWLESDRFGRPNVDFTVRPDPPEKETTNADTA